LAFLRWFEVAGVTPELTKTTVQAFTADLLDAGAQAATARTRHMPLRQFAAWLADEGEIDANPLIGLKPPKLDSKVVDALSDNQLRRPIKACAGTELIDRRDEAIVRVADLPPSDPGSVELAVESELGALPAAQLRPSLAAVALAMARILDGRVPTPKPAAAKVLVSVLETLHRGSAQGRRGNLAVVNSMTRKGGA
jgi:hypothetical protein